jgi:CHASE2 domain-containing sensor protein
MVMARVRLDPFRRRPTRPHWGWIALLVLVAAVCSPWLFLAGQVDRDLAMMIAWGAALFATSISLAGLSYQLLDL